MFNSCRKKGEKIFFSTMRLSFFKFRHFNIFISTVCQLDNFLGKINNIKVIWIFKKSAQEMSCSSKVSRTFEFLSVFRAAEKIQAKV